jgi:hypothetical protein
MVTYLLYCLLQFIHMPLVNPFFGLKVLNSKYVTILPMHLPFVRSGLTGEAPRTVFICFALLLRLKLLNTLN